jgi:hypothetical protein
MTEEPGWVPPDIDTSKANIARVYDYWLGGSHNFRADQDAARTLIALDTNMRTVMRANRAFIGRAVRFLAAQAGVRQFLDIGSGIPTDNDEVVVAHSRLILQDNPDAAVVQADLREPAKILAAPETQLLIDFSQPVAVLLVAVLHFIPESAGPAQIMATLRDALAPGSYLVICHSCRDARPEMADSAADVYTSRVAAQVCLRTRDQIADLFDGFQLVDPGLVWLPEWRPEAAKDVPEHPEQYWALVGVGQRDATGGGQPG